MIRTALSCLLLALVPAAALSQTGAFYALQKRLFLREVKAEVARETKAINALYPPGPPFLASRPDLTNARLLSRLRAWEAREVRAFNAYLRARPASAFRFTPFD